MKDPGRVLILWQHPLFRETLQAILAEAGIATSAAPISAFREQARSATQPAARFIIAEGDRELGRQILESRTNDDLQVLAFSMDDNRAHLWRYQEWAGLTRREIVQLISGSLPYDAGSKLHSSQ